MPCYTGSSDNNYGIIMAEKLPTLTVPPSRKPSFLNARAVGGLAVGMLLTGVVPYAAPIGLVAGAWLGKRKMQRETMEGKEVKPPSSWNFGTFLGSASGLGVGIVGATLGLLAFGAITGGAGLLAGGAVAAAAATASVGWGLATALAAGGAALATVAGGWIGGKIGKFFQKRQYEAAEQHVMAHGEFMPASEQQVQIPQREQALGQGLAPHVPQMQPTAPQAGQDPQKLSTARGQIDPQQLAQLHALAAQAQGMLPAQPETMTDKVGHSRPTGPQER